MTKLQRERQLEKRKNIVGCVILGAMSISAILFCNAMGSTGDAIPDDSETIAEIETIEYETETEFTLALVEAPVVEEPNEWEEFESTTEIVEETTEIETEIVEIKEKEVEKTSKSYSEDDVNRLAHLIWAEAGGSSKQDVKAMEYTGSVVLNRVNSDRFPNSIKKVIAEKGQYGVAKYYMKKKPSEKAYAIAKDLLENGSKLPSDYFGQANYKTYKKYGKDYKKVGKIYFFNLK